MEKEIYNLSHRPLFNKVFREEDNAKLLIEHFFNLKVNSIKFIKILKEVGDERILLLVNNELTILSVDKIEDIVIISKTIVDKNYNGLKKQLVFI